MQELGGVLMSRVNHPNMPPYIIVDIHRWWMMDLVAGIKHNAGRHWCMFSSPNISTYFHSEASMMRDFASFWFAVLAYSISYILLFSINILRISPFPSYTTTDFLKADWAQHKRVEVLHCKAPGAMFFFAGMACGFDFHVDIGWYWLHIIINNV